MACVVRPWDITTHLHSVSNFPSMSWRLDVDWYSSMSPWHEWYPVHGIRDIPWDISTHLHIMYKKKRMSWHLDGDWLYFHVDGRWIDSCSWHTWYSQGHIDTFTHYVWKDVCHGTWMETDYISMSRDMNKFLFMACVICPWHTSTNLHSVSILPVCHGAWMMTDYISMSPGHELHPVHGMRDMSLGHSDTFTFCIETPRMSWRLDGDWLYFHVPGTWISSRSWHAWYVSGTYRHIYILYQNPPYVMAIGWLLIIFPCPQDMNYFLFMACVICPCDIATHLHSVSNTPVYHGDCMETENSSMSLGQELVTVHGIRDMSLGHINTFTLCIKTPRISWHLDGDWV